MVKEINENVVRIVVLDVSSVYVQIHDQGYFDKNSIEDVKLKYSNTNHWKVLVLE